MAESKEIERQTRPEGNGAPEHAAAAIAEAPLEAEPARGEISDAAHVEFPEPSPEATTPAEAPARVAAPRKRRGFWQKFTLFIALLGLVATAAGGLAVKFKDKDERLRVISDWIEGAAKNPHAVVATLMQKLGALSEQATPRQGAAPSHEAPARPAVAEAPPAARPAAPQAELAVTPLVAPPAPAAAPAAGEQHPAPAALWAPPREVAPVAAVNPTTQQERPAQVAAATRAEAGTETAALAKKVEKLEAIAAEALETARAAQRIAARPGEQKPAAEALAENADFSVVYALEGRIDALSDQLGELRARIGEPRGETLAPSAPPSDALTALEGRINALNDGLGELRARIEEPKGETRAPRELVEAAPPPPPAPPVSLTALETLTLAQSLQHAMDLGRPFPAEHAALSERGVDPQLLAALAPSAAHGAPTAAQMLAAFAPLAKRLRALDNEPTAPEASFADRLLHDAGKLVHARPASAPPAASIEDIVLRIEATLAEGDVGAAAQAFTKLPETAKAEAKVFGENLERRREAEQATASLLEGAIAGLGHVRN